MKKEYSTLPGSMANMETYGFSWMEFITAIPAPLFVATTYKANGKPNACLQSWACFSGDSNGFYAILSNVNKNGHFYQSLQETKEAVLNFPSAELYDKCQDTIKNNGYDNDEIALSGLTAGKASMVNAPRIEECFLNLECRYAWERTLAEGSSPVVVCLKIVNICAEEKYLDEAAQGRYDEGGYLYNIHHPVDPGNFTGKSHDWVAVLKKIKDMGEY